MKFLDLFGAGGGKKGKGAGKARKTKNPRSVAKAAKGKVKTPAFIKAKLAAKKGKK